MAAEPGLIGSIFSMRRHCWPSVDTRCSIPIPTPTIWKVVRERISLSTSRLVQQTIIILSIYLISLSFSLQAQLEAEIENLSWKIERAETTDLGDLENQMDIAEKRRTTLLKDFFPLVGKV